MKVESDIEGRLDALASAAAAWLDPALPERRLAVEKTLACRNTFTVEAIGSGIESVMKRITPRALRDWLGGSTGPEHVRVAVLNAGNVPFVGLQDLLAVIGTGGRYLGVLSSKSPYLLPAFVETARRVGLEAEASFMAFDEALGFADLLVATGADATVARVSALAIGHGIGVDRQLLRGTRISAAVLDGFEGDEELAGLAHDALLHEGRGCLNVSVMWLPEGQEVEPICRKLEEFRTAYPPHETTIRLLGLERRFLRATDQWYRAGTGFILTDGRPVPGRAGVIAVARYSDPAREVSDWLSRNLDRLQMVALRSGFSTGSGFIPREIPTGVLGTLQDPPIDWKPDGKDTVSFLARSTGLNLIAENHSHST